jgi:hypothetical protein
LQLKKSAILGSEEMENKKNLLEKGQLQPQDNGMYSAISLTEKPNKVYRFAEAYAKVLNWSVIPLHSIVNGQCTCKKKDCASPGKHPRTVNGVKDATTDVETIRKWFRQWPNINIGIATGKVNNLTVLDVDGAEGEESLKELIDKYGALPETVEQITGSGGHHYFFNYVEGIRNKVKFLPGLDVRSDNGFVVAPPSNHISGRYYEFELSSTPANTPIAKMSEWLQHTIGKEQQCSKKTARYWMKLLQGVGDGQRNVSTASLSGYLLRHGIDPHIALELVFLWNERNDPPEEKEAIKTTFNSILRTEIKRRKGAGA